MNTPLVFFKRSKKGSKKRAIWEKKKKDAQTLTLFLYPPAKKETLPKLLLFPLTTRAAGEGRYFSFKWYYRSAWLASKRTLHFVSRVTTSTSDVPGLGNSGLETGACIFREHTGKTHVAVMARKGFLG